MKILVNTPDIHALGGVANHYLGLKPYWTENVKYNTVGKRYFGKGKFIKGIYCFPWDILKFLFRLLTFHPNMVIVNSSLGTSALKRDFFFLNLARFFGFRVTVFMHGFNEDYAKKMNKEWASHNLNKASLIFVLADAFKTEMKSWGVTSPIQLTTTKVDDKLLDGYDVKTERDGTVRNILFLARIEKEKGVFITIDAYRILKKKYPQLSLTIAGDGSALPKVKQFVEKENIPDVHIIGRVSGKDLINAYKKADLSCSPSYSEGMPTAVLEAMAFGLPVFTRNVGGLVDFFENGKMGYMSDSFNPIDFANAMMPFIENEKLTHKVAQYNTQYAKNHFLASSVALHVQSIIKKHLKK